MALNTLIVVGASAGGVQTTSQLLGLIAPPLLAAIVLVVHISPSSPGVLPAILGRRTRLTVKRAEHGELLTDGVVYVAPPDRHVLVRDGRIETNRGPRENRQRPGIDPLFRSAALAHGPRVIGVVLTGLLDDGTAGLTAIKREGGVAIVQEPAEAMFPAMPQSALQHVQVDHRVGVVQMASLLSRLAKSPVTLAHEPAAGASTQTNIMERGVAESAAMQHSGRDEIGKVSAQSQADRSGPLYRIEDGPLAGYRCHVGCAPTAASVVDGQGVARERSLWASLRVLEERAKILDKMALDERRHGRSASAAAYALRSAESQRHASEIRSLLGGKDVP